ncbi:MAG: hypothetical protein ACLR13_04740 [Acutalibacteraceae bacterium]
MSPWRAVEDGNGSTGTGDAVQAGVTSTSNTGTSKNTLVFAGEGQSVLNPLLNNTDDIQSIIFFRFDEI